MERHTSNIHNLKYTQRMRNTELPWIKCSASIYIKRFYHKLQVELVSLHDLIMTNRTTLADIVS